MRLTTLTGAAQFPGISLPTVAMETSGYRPESVYRRYDIVSQGPEKHGGKMEQFLGSLPQESQSKQCDTASELSSVGDRGDLGWVEGFEPSATGTTIRRSTN